MKSCPACNRSFPESEIFVEGKCYSCTVNPLYNPLSKLFSLSLTPGEIYRFGVEVMIDPETGIEKYYNPALKEIGGTT